MVNGKFQKPAGRCRDFREGLILAGIAGIQCRKNSKKANKGKIIKKIKGKCYDEV